MKTNHYPRTIDLQSWLPGKGNILFTVLMIALTLWAQSVGAITLGATTATNSAINIPYQGSLTDAHGKPLSGQQVMSFNLYNQPTGGSPLWTENRLGANSVEVEDGLFNVMLGSVTTLPQRVVTENDVLYLGVAVGTNAEMTPRVVLGRVPYAVVADTVPDGSISREKLATPNMFPVQVGNFVTRPNGTTKTLSHRVDISHLNLNSRPKGIAQVTNGSHRHNVFAQYDWDASSATEIVIELYRPYGEILPNTHLRIIYVLFP